MIKRTLILLFILGLFSWVPSFSQGNPAFNGQWELIQEKSIDLGRASFILKIQIEDSKITLTRKFEMGRRSGTAPEDVLTVTTDGKSNKFIIDNRTFPSMPNMGIIMPVGEEKNIKAVWLDNGNILKLEESYPLWTSQGMTEIKNTHLYKLDPVKEEIVYTLERNTRINSPATRFVFKPKNKNNACYMKLEDDWDINGKLPPQAFLITLQGVVNSSSPQLYFIYGEKWDYKFTPGVFDFLKEKHNFSFTQLTTTQQALDKFKDQIKGYVVWDKNVRTSLIVAFTVCGLEGAVAITEDMIPMMEKAGIKVVEDFRGKFTGKSDLEIYQWAYDKYWKRCSRDFIVWLGGEHGTIMRPGVADFGIMKKAFFTDASCSQRDKEEFEFAKKLMSEQETMSMVMGWHSYKKDRERDFTTLASSFALRVEGLHTLPNMSFTANVPATKGFKFKNNHNLVLGKQYIPEKKVYMTFIQSDCLGLGAWTEPGRGQIPYTWEVTMNWLWLAPSMLEYFYGQSTPNDYFIGALSGPGYMYPKAIPKKYLPEVFGKAVELMKQLDLNAFEIMDHSEDRNADLPKDLVDAYYEYMPNSIGFINGYGPAHTFTSKNGRPFLSFDYYVSQNRPDAEVIADFQELGKLNAQRPYFMTVHVREYSTIERMKAIFDKLGPEFELVPTDIFIKMAGNNPTFKEYYKK